jgi:uncharacterized membrane protein
MNPWPFVTIAYVLTLGAAAGLVFHAWRAMRSQERGDK